ncbi:MAG TPA: hypothetical protein VK013_00110 [Myxococcaceae bacterium]|nr:hypothetical protein [Myxococcaceae bacterium]
MAVGRVGGGSKGRAGGVRGGGAARGPAGASKAAGGFPRVERSESLVGPSGLAGGGNVGGADPVTAQALMLAKQLKSGQLRSREEATRKLVGDILHQKLRLKSQSLTQKVADALQDDPRLQAALERLWGSAEEGGGGSAPNAAPTSSGGGRVSGWTVKGD